MVAKYPGRFIAAIACLPMNDMDAAVKEAEKASTELKFKGVQIYTPVGEKPLDRPEFMPLYETMAKKKIFAENAKAFLKLP
jgi:predicted TIM-barrel fold metal-dependent hydrolase